jgi:hypothetical protein
MHAVRNQAQLIDVRKLAQACNPFACLNLRSQLFGALALLAAGDHLFSKAPDALHAT